MLELGAGADILRAVSWLYLGLMGVLIAIALWQPKRIWQKALAVIAVLLVFLGPAYMRGQEQAQQMDERKARYEKAKALFDERCTAAGEKIVRTVDNVDGVIWMKWRSAGLNHEQFALDDPYGKDCSMEGCIFRLLRGNQIPPTDRDVGKQSSMGYSFVETIDPRDGIRYRYTAVFRSISDVPNEQFSEHVRRTGYGAEVDGRFLELHREPVSSFSARFGIVWEDISTREDRDYWIAGGALKVIDMATSEVIAQRLGYLIDTGQGSTAGARDPWGWARSYAPQCPNRRENIWSFAVRTLQPTKK